MKTLMRKMKKVCVLITIAAFGSLMPGVAVYPQEDSVERHMQNGSRVMAPGWLNVDNQKGRAFKEQVLQKGVSAEKQMKRIGADLERSLLERTTDTVKPDLKKKTAKVSSAAPTGVATFETLVIQADNVIVEQALVEIAEAEGIEQGAIDYAALTTGDIVFTWQKDGAIYGRVYDDTGAISGDADAAFQSALFTPGQNVDYVIQALYDGGFVVGYSSSNDGWDSSTSIYTTFFSRFDSQNNTFTGFSVGGGSGKITSITGLSDGRFAAAWDGGYFDTSYFRIIGADNNFGSEIYLGSSYYQSNYGYTRSMRPQLVTLTNGNIAAAWYTESHYNYPIIGYSFSGYYSVYNPDNNGMLSYTSIDGSYGFSPNVISLSNGGFAISWSNASDTMYFRTFDASGGYDSSRIEIASFQYDYYTTSPTGFDQRYCAPTMVELSNGKIAVVYGNIALDGYRLSVYGEDGTWITTAARLTYYEWDRNLRVHALEGDTLAISYEHGYDSPWAYGQYSATGEVFGSEQIFAMPTETRTRVSAAADFDMRGASDTSAFSRLDDGYAPNLFATLSFGNEYGEPLGARTLISAFRGLLELNSAGMLNAEGMPDGVLDPALLAELLAGVLEESAFMASMGELTSQEMQMVMMLASIINNPTIEQQEILDVLEALISQVQKMAEDTGSAPELEQTSDDFTQMVAAVLLAQALPGLLKEGDMSNVKGIFGDLDREKSNILLQYGQQASRYYELIAEELAANMTTLQIKGLLKKNITAEEELTKLPFDQIDAIVKKIRNAKDKTITEERVLKAEAKYREEHLMPAKRMLEQNMKTLLQGFTKKLFGVLDGAGLVKEKAEQGKPVLNIDLSAK